MARIVIMDDSRFQRKTLAKIIKKDGHVVMQAKDGHEGLFRIATYYPDLVISDLVMPNVDGIEVLERLYYKKFDVPIIIISSDIQTATKERCHKLGVSGFINKPITEDTVLACVRKVLAKIDKNENSRGDVP